MSEPEPLEKPTPRRSYMLAWVMVMGVLEISLVVWWLLER
jgi:hypothetical protein